jgi:hypothetical protein
MPKGYKENPYDYVCCFNCEYFERCDYQPPRDLTKKEYCDNYIELRKETEKIEEKRKH